MIPFGIALDTAIAFLKRAAPSLIIPLAAFALFVSIRLWGFLWWDGAIEQRDKARAQVAQMEAASKEARAKQIALNTANQELSQRIAADAQARHAELANATSRAVADYARRNSLQNYCRGSGTGIAPVPNDPGAPPEAPQDDMVAIPNKHLEYLAEDAMQGAEARSILIDWLNSGLAVVYPEPKLSGD